MKKLILFISFITLSLCCHASIWVVDSLNDSGTGSLRSKISLATTGDTIRFNRNLIANGSDSIVLTSQIAFGKSVTIKGLYTAIDTLFISGGGTNRVFSITNADSMILDSLVFVNSYIPFQNSNFSNRGGAIKLYNCDSVVFKHCIFRNNHGQLGGGIRSVSSPTFVYDCIFMDNSAAMNGGAISTNDTASNVFDSTRLVVVGSQFLRNITDYGAGGGINFLSGAKHGDLQITDCVFRNNKSSRGGAIGVGESSASSGIVYVAGRTRIKRTLFEENHASYGGAVIFDYIGDVNISYSSFVRNLAYASNGGAIYMKSLSVIDLELEQTSIIENTAKLGGAVCFNQNLDASSLSFLNCSVFGNHALNGGVIYIQPSSFLNNFRTFFKGSILANNGDTAYGGGINPVMTSNGYNIFSDTIGLVMQVSDHLDTNHSQVNLGPILNNGGDLPGRMPMMPSIAVNAGDPTDLTDAQNIPINGLRDIGAVEYCAPTYRTDTIVACSSYTWVNGVTYMQSDTITNFSIINTQGCDSILNLYLTILEPTFSHDTISTCDNYTWLNGNTYYASNNSARHIVTNSVGCDSTIYLYLTITNSVVEYFNVCDSLVWRNGVTYAQNNYWAQDTVVVSGSCDSLFLLNLTIHNQVTSTETHTVCDSLTWINGITYYSSTNNTVKDTLTNRLGCDSIVTLDLTVNHTIHDTDYVTGCLFYTWIDGQVYLSDNNTATHLLQAASGCDSIMQLDLEINYGTIATDYHTVCDSLLWIDGNTYYSNNTIAIHTLVGGNSNGCDSVITLNLTVNSIQDVDVVSSCSSYTWIDGITYTSNNNSAMYTTTNGFGCDSTVTLDLTILNTSTGADIVTACASYIWNGITYTANNNSAQDTLVNSAGCDSIVTLDLTILNSSTGIDVISSCNPITWIDGNTYSANNNIATYVLVNSLGCDSVVTLEFTLIQPSSATDVIISCTKITWIDGITYDQTTNGPTFTIPNSNGCDSVITLDFTLLEVDTAVTRNYLTLTAQATNATYQWIDCANGVIAGEIKANFTATVNGSYEVAVTQNGCIDTSACFDITNVDVQEVELIGISLYPNPTGDVLNIDKGNNASLEITITNSVGGMVHQSTTQSQITTVNMSQYAVGMYVVTLKNELGMKVEKVVKR